MPPKSRRDPLYAALLFAAVVTALVGSAGLARGEEGATGSAKRDAPTPRREAKPGKAGAQPDKEDATPQKGDAAPDQGAANPTKRALAPQGPPVAREAETTLPRRVALAPGETFGTEKIDLFYFPQATRLQAILNALANTEGNPLYGLKTEVVSETQLLIQGTDRQRVEAHRLLASVDLPISGVKMDMWGVQISSGHPQRMANVLRDINGMIERSRGATHDTYRELQLAAADLPADSQFAVLFSNELGYTGAFEEGRTLSVTDVLLRLIASRDPSASAEKFASRMTAWLNESYPDYTAAVRRQGHLPFQRFFHARGLTWNGDAWKADQVRAPAYVREARASVLRFAVQNLHSVHGRESFSPNRLQLTADALNERLQLAIDALSQDMADLFLTPTLEGIRQRVAREKGVEYAQVGRTSVTTLSNFTTKVESSSVSVVDNVPPLRIGELLQRANELEPKFSQLFRPATEAGASPGGAGAAGAKPAAGGGASGAGGAGGTKGSAAGGSGGSSGSRGKSAGSVGSNAPRTAPAGGGDPAGNADELLSAGQPYSHLLGLVAALGEDRTVWQNLNQGVSIDVTPRVLRNASSAELTLTLVVCDPQATPPNKDVRPVSRVAKHEVHTRVYVNALDLLDLSTFSSQATVYGGRSYVPVVGDVWRGIFGSTPVLGNLFSFKHNPKNVYHQSLLLSTATITPTSMAVTLLYPDQRDGVADASFDFPAIERRVESYITSKED